MTTDILALVSMKNAAKCEKPCELHNTWIIKSLNASGAWEVASKHVCLRVVFKSYFYNSIFNSSFISFIWIEIRIDWLIVKCFDCFIWFSWMNWIYFQLIYFFIWDELRESSLFVYFNQMKDVFLFQLPINLKSIQINLWFIFILWFFDFWFDC